MTAKPDPMEPRVPDEAMDLEDILEFAEAGTIRPIPIFPWFRPASGLYRAGRRIGTIPLPESPLPTPMPRTEATTEELGPEEELLTAEAEAAEAEVEEVTPFPYWLLSEELRLDVDGRYPQLVASGTIKVALRTRLHWIAKLKRVTTNQWRGVIWYKDGNTTLLPHTTVMISVQRSWFPNQQRAIVTFRGGGAPSRRRRFEYVSRYFHPVEFEYDTVRGTTNVTSIDTCAHPNRPSSLPCETLTIKKVFQRAGFDVSVTTQGGYIPLVDPDNNGTWSDMEMHDAMQAYWSRFANTAQWSMWTLFAAQHDMGHVLGGIMFDDIGPNHRQGTAVFTDSFISDAPTGDPHPAAWVNRMRFWTACHEMGHCFNLAHSWDKDHPPSWGMPWIPLIDEPEARSFMNYPFRVMGGQSAFFADFEYRFSDQELLFMRHAPARFVQMGNADWFDHHGFQQAALSAEPTFQLSVRTHRARPLFEFLEPIVLELKLKNISNQTVVLDEQILSEWDRMTVIIKKKDKVARQWAPYAQYCILPHKIGLEPNDSVYDTLFVSAGLNGWDLAEPGVYTVQLVLHLDDEDIVSNPLMLKVAPPQTHDEELLAQDFFSDDVGRILAFDGSEYLKPGNETLQAITERLSDRAVVLHTRLALGNPLRKDYKVLPLEEGQVPMTGVSDIKGEFAIRGAKVEDARSELYSALLNEPDRAAETLSHVDYNYYMNLFGVWLDESGDPQSAATCFDTLRETLAARGVSNAVLAAIETKREQLVVAKAKAKVSKREPVGTSRRRK